MHVNGKCQEMECPQITSFFPAVSSLLFESPHAVNKGQSSAELRSSGQSMRSPCTWPRTRCCPAEAPLRLRCLRRLRLSGRSLWSSHLLTLCFLQVQKRLSHNQNHESHVLVKKHPFHGPGETLPLRDRSFLAFSHSKAESISSPAGQLLLTW